ncbi:MAG: vWA domain-containing protein [Terracidiphilus sp.]|jgi:hypothetical protein
MRRIGLAIWMIAGALLMAAPTFAQSDKATGQGRAVVTIFAKHSEVAPNISQQDVSVKVNGKDSTVTGWAPFKGANDGLELVVLIDGGARNLGRQFDEIKDFVKGLGPHAKVAVGYMENGRAALASPLSADHAQVVGELHLPSGPHSSPYFSLSDLAQNWPSQARGVRREVVLFTDGIDPNNPRFDPNDPYVEAAINDSVRAGLVVYTICWRSRPDGGENSMMADGGQSLLAEVTQATGGNSYWMGTGNPVSFQPFFEDLARRLENQYELDFTARLDHKPTIETMKLKVEGLALEVASPQLVFVDRAGAAE